VARILGEKLSASLGKPVIHREPPRGVDGDRLGVRREVGSGRLHAAAGAANLAINPYFMQDIPFDVVKDFAAVVAHASHAVRVRRERAVSGHALQELIASVRHGTQTTFGTAGPEAAAARDFPTGANDRPAEDDRSALQGQLRSASRSDLEPHQLQIDPCSLRRAHQAGTLRALA